MKNRRIATVGSSLDEKIASLSPERRARVEERIEQIRAERATLKELRKWQKKTQTDVAEVLGVQQATVAMYERRSDLLLSTLRKYIQAVGGSFEMTVKFPGKEPVVLDGPWAEGENAKA